MSINLHNLRPSQKKKNKKRFGRGNASGRGTYSGRGQKGQKARSGGKRGLKLKALRRIWKKIPKRGGFKSRREKVKAFNLEFLGKRFSENEEITPQLLLKNNLIRSEKEKIKILGKKIDKKLKIFAHAFSKSAEEAIQKAGGTIEKIAKKIKKS